MQRYTDAWDRTYQDITWALPCEPGVTFECTPNVINDIIAWLPHMFKKYKKMRGVEMAFEIDGACLDLDASVTWYRVSFKEKENQNDIERTF